MGRSEITATLQPTPSAISELGAVAILVCFECIENDFDAAIVSGIFAANVRWKAKRLGYAGSILNKMQETIWQSVLKKRPDLMGFTAVFVKAANGAIEATKNHFDGSDLQGRYWRRFASKELVSTDENTYLATTGFISIKLDAEFNRLVSVQ